MDTPLGWAAFWAVPLLDALVCASLHATNRALVALIRRASGTAPKP